MNWIFLYIYAVLSIFILGFAVASDGKELKINAIVQIITFVIKWGLLLAFIFL